MAQTTNAIQWFVKLDTIAKKRVAQRYTQETEDETNIAEGLNLQAEEWLLKNFPVIPIFTVEELFDIDREECNEEVIRISDLTEEQKIYLGITQTVG